MIHQFEGFEIDESQRELRVGNRVLSLQPRVFDLLVYLARHRDRVVSKDELLETVWPGVIVADGSLQRAVCLARNALSAAGASGVIRTFARRGYRLCAPGPDGAGAETLARMTPGDLHRRAYEAHFAGRSQETLDELERLVVHNQSRADRRAAAWTSLIIGQLRFERREFELAQGWHQHAVRLLNEEPPGLEQGYADLLGCRLALYSDPEAAVDLAESARAAGTRFQDSSLEGMGLLSLAEARLFLGHTRAGLAALDEAGVAVLAGGLNTWASALVYCGMIFCCMTRADWRRAGQWTEQFNRWGADKGVMAYPMLCRLHRVEVLTVRGELATATAELRALHESLARLSPWVEGEIWRVSGELHAAMGDFDAAREAYQRAIAVGWDALFEIALLRMEEGDPAAAAKSIGSLIAANAWSCRSKPGRAWTHYCIAAARAGDLSTARAALAKVRDAPELVSTPGLQALTTTAHAELRVAEGDTPGGISLLRSALAAWLEMDAPLAAAHAHCRLARLLLAEGEMAFAELEFKVATMTFDRTGAIHALNRCIARFEAARLCNDKSGRKRE